MTDTIYSLIKGLEQSRDVLQKEIDATKDEETPESYSQLEAMSEELAIIEGKIEALRQVAGVVEAVLDRYEYYHFEGCICSPSEIKEEILGTRAEGEK